MIAVIEALHCIANEVKRNDSQTLSLEDALGYVLAEDVISPMNMPPFRQSSMDGYALRLSEVDTYSVIGEVQAGSPGNFTLKAQEAVRIFTGGRVPDDATTVVIQEHTEQTGGKVLIKTKPITGANIRPVGEQIKEGTVALKSGIILNEAGLGFLAGLGITEVTVFKKPKVHILITGNEIVQQGQLLKEGQAYDSNSITLKSALSKQGIKEIKVDYIPDTLEATVQKIKIHLKEADVLLLSGGISVGDYDFVREALPANQVKEHFYKVNQKPGKPLWFGTKENKVVFALPGNPASSLSCFYVYVIPALKKLMGREEIHLSRNKAVATTEIKNPYGKELFLKAQVSNGNAEALTGQASSMLKSFAIANALIQVPSNVNRIEAGEEVQYIALPN